MNTTYNVKLLSTGKRVGLKHLPISKEATKVFRPKQKLFVIDGQKILAHSTQSAVAALVDLKQRMS